MYRVREPAVRPGEGGTIHDDGGKFYAPLGVLKGG